MQIFGVGHHASPTRLSTGNGHESRFQVAGGHFSHIASAAVLSAVRGSRHKILEGRFGVCPQRKPVGRTPPSVASVNITHDHTAAGRQVSPTVGRTGVGPSQSETTDWTGN